LVDYLKISALQAILVIGVIISVYLAYSHYNPGALVCPTSGLINCQEVITSSYSIIFGVPLAIYAVIWFLIALILSFSKRSTLAELWFLIGIGGIIYSLFSMYMLGKICEFCSTLDVIIIASIVLLFKGQGLK
jgi:uncharacterized membrane protein